MAQTSSHDAAANRLRPTWPSTFEPEAEVGRISERILEQVGPVLRRRGVVVAVSGGIDSSVSAALAVEAMGRDRVLALSLPERDSDADSGWLAERVSEHLGIELLTEEISPVLEACGCYARRDEAIRQVVPDFGEGWKCKIVLPEDTMEGGKLTVFYLVVESPDGERERHRLPPEAYRGIVAATGFKQRVRKMFEYYHADRLHYAVLGTPNRLEFDQGFFVKGGDGLADLKPIAHLYKREVYALAEYLDLPEEVRGRSPSTDTYSLEQEQGEFYFGLDTLAADRVLEAVNEGESPEEVAEELDLPLDRVERAFEQTEGRRAATRYQHAPPLLVEGIPEVDPPATVDGS